MYKGDTVRLSLKYHIFLFCRIHMFFGESDTNTVSGVGRNFLLRVHKLRIQHGFVLFDLDFCLDFSFYI